MIVILLEGFDSSSLFSSHSLTLSRHYTLSLEKSWETQPQTLNPNPQSNPPYTLNQTLRNPKLIPSTIPSNQTLRNPILNPNPNPKLSIQTLNLNPQLLSWEEGKGIDVVVSFNRIPWHYCTSTSGTPQLSSQSSQSSPLLQKKKTC